MPPEEKVYVQYPETAPLGPEPATELPRGRGLRWFPGEIKALDPVEAAKLLRRPTHFQMVDPPATLQRSDSEDQPPAGTPPADPPAKRLKKGAPQ